MSLSEHRHGVAERFDEYVGIARQGVGAKGGPRRRGEAEAPHQWLGGRVPWAHADAELVEDLGDVVRVHPLDVETDDAPTLNRVVWSDHTHATGELARQSAQGVVREGVLVANDVLETETLEVSHGGAQTDRLGDRRRPGLEARRPVRRRVAVNADVRDHPATTEERRHRVEDLLAGPKDPDAGRPEHLVPGEDEEVDVEVDDV